MTDRRLLLLLPLLLAGCKSAEKGGPLGFGLMSRDKDASPSSAGSQRAAVDPILTNGRIPPQTIPVPGRDGYALDGKRDPLLGPPPARDDRPADRTAGAGRRTPAKPEETSGTTGSVPRVSVPYRPSRATTPAALASRIDPNDPAFRVGDDPPPLSVGRGDRTADELMGELKKLGSTVTRPSLEKGGYVARGEVELDPDGRPGIRRAYEAAGATPAAALRQLLGQISGDVKR
jgi:hypothetical protein